MLQQLRKLFNRNTEDFGDLIKAGAQLIDVRSRQEFNGGHLKGSINILLHDLGAQLSKIKKEKPVIMFCASGMRSGSAKNLLQSKGFTVYNGGSWSSLERKLKKS